MSQLVNQIQTHSQHVNLTMNFELFGNFDVTYALIFIPTYQTTELTVIIAVVWCMKENIGILILDVEFEHICRQSSKVVENPMS